MQNWMRPGRLALSAILLAAPVPSAAGADLFGGPDGRGRAIVHVPPEALRAYTHIHDFPYWDLIRGPRWQDQNWRFQAAPCREPAHRAWIGHTHYRSATAGRRNPNE